MPKAERIPQRANQIAITGPMAPRLPVVRAYTIGSAGRVDHGDRYES